MTSPRNECADCGRMMACERYRRGWLCGTCTHRRIADGTLSIPCAMCGESLGSENSGRAYHLDCEPTLCVCADPDPDGIGECRTCHRRYLPQSEIDRHTRNNQLRKMRP